MSGLTTSILVLGGIFAAGAEAQTSVLNLTAVTANVANANDPIRINVLRWSTDAERDKLMAAWNMTNASGRGGAGRGGGRGAAAGRGGRNRAAAAEDVAPDPDADSNVGFADRYKVEEVAATTPEGSLATALKQTGSLGYLWSSEVAGYAIRYAGKVAAPDGSERVILITDRRLGKTNTRWKPADGAQTAYDFSVIELRLNAKGEGEGKISIAGKVTPDSAAKIVALENYAAMPVVLKNVKPKQGSQK